MLFYKCTECPTELNCPCDWHYACSVCHMFQATHQEPQPYTEQEFLEWLNTVEKAEE